MAASTRMLAVVANVGLDASVAASTSVALVLVDEAPLAGACLLTTATGIPAEGILSGSDPEGGALTWEIVTPPASGTLLLLDAATGAVRYVPVAGASGDVTFNVRASDGTTWSAPATVTVRISEPLAATRRLIISTPPREGFLGTALTYTVTVDLRALPLGTVPSFRLVGVPAGSTATVTPTAAGSATVTWTAAGCPQQHQQLGLIVSDPVSGVSGYQPIQVLWQAALGGAG